MCTQSTAYFQKKDDEALSRMSHDLNCNDFNLQWPSVLEFEAWLEPESKKLSIDFTIHGTMKPFKMAIAISSNLPNTPKRSTSMLSGILWREGFIC